MTKAILVSLSSPVSSDRDSEFNEWFNAVHGKEVLELAGFTKMTRYRALTQAVPPKDTPSHRYLAVYELDDAAAAEKSLAEGAPKFSMTDALDLSGAMGIFFEEIFSTAPDENAARLEANKAVARRLIETLGAFDVDGFLDCLSDDVVFETPGQFAFAGFKTKSDLAKEFPAMREMIPGGIAFTINVMTAEEDRVHVELTGKSRTIDGVDYNNRYHYALIVRDGKVVSFRDYLDSDLAIKVFGPAFERHGAANYVSPETVPA